MNAIESFSRLMSVTPAVLLGAVSVREMSIFHVVRCQIDESCTPHGQCSHLLTTALPPRTIRPPDQVGLVLVVEVVDLAFLP